MKNSKTASKNNSAKPTKKAGVITTRSRIHPVIIYPFQRPDDYKDLAALYRLVAELDDDRENYARPITVLDRKTHYALEHEPEFRAFRKGTVEKYSTILDEWCVDTCQMWYAGLARAFESGGENDVYWLIPGDFNYGTPVGQQVLERLHDLPEIILDCNQDFCVGEIITDHNNSKQLIDTYATFALLYNWFPTEAQEIRQFTERPRSEFFAVRHGFFQDVLKQRWYPYEQTVVMLLRAVFTKRKISRFSVGNISDLPEGRESLASALQQVERTERVLKSIWREAHQSQPGWVQEYRRLESQSEQVRSSALTVLQNLLS